MGLTKGQIERRKKELERIRRFKVQLLAERENLRQRGGLYFFKPYRWQELFIEGVRGHNIALTASSNKRGKTAVGSCIVISWCLGFEPWVSSEDERPGYVKVGQGWFRKSSLGMDPPVDIVVCGEDWKMHIGQTLVKELKRWCPDGFYTTKRNEQGVEYLWNFENGSHLTIMSYAQDDDLFESFRAQGAWLDEPPPKKKYDAIARGLLLDRGKLLMTLTPLKEPWILDDLILTERGDIYLDKGNLLDNEALYGEEVACLRDMGLNDRQVGEYFDLLLYQDKPKDKPVNDKGAAALEYLKRIVDDESKVYDLKIFKFIREIDPSEVAPRVFGDFKSLVGRVLKEFDPKVHVIEDFKVPVDWPVVPMIDFHLSKPQAISFWAIDSHGIEYCIGEVWDNLTAEQIADTIIRKMKSDNLLIKEAFIDPLSKGDTAYLRNRAGMVEDSFTIIYNKLADEGITLQIGSKDKVSGISNIISRLTGANGIPTAYIFRSCKRHLHEVLRWVYDEFGTPVKENDHFMENWYRFTLTGVKYNAYKVAPIPEEPDLGENAWLAA